MRLDRAKQFAAQHFPAGPEKLAEELGVDIREGPLTGCDGWVLSGPTGVLIRLNSKATATRRRFTLAHELGHLLLGVPTIVGESLYDSLRSNSAEERKVNDLASELLVPESIVRKYLSSVPVVAAQLQKLAEKARISELAAAIRVTNLAPSIGLVNAAVVFFKDGLLEWQWSKTIEMHSSEAEDLLKRATLSHPKPVRIPQSETNEIVVASLIQNTVSKSTTLFVQLLPPAVGNRPSEAERREQLERDLFKNDPQFRMELQGVFGAFRSQCRLWSVDHAYSEFYRQKGQRWSGERRTRLHSENGREYVRLRLRELCS